MTDLTPTEALTRLGYWCRQGTGIKDGGYPIPSKPPNLPAVAVFWTGYGGGEAGRITYRGGQQEILVLGEVRIFVADQNEAGKVQLAGDVLVTKLLDRFAPRSGNLASTLQLPAQEGMVKHIHFLDGGQVSQILAAWNASFYGAVLPFEIKLIRQPEAIA